MIESFTIAFYNSNTHDLLYKFDYRWDNKTKCYVSGQVSSTKARTFSVVPTKIATGEYTYWRMLNVKFSERNINA